MIFVCDIRIALLNTEKKHLTPKTLLSTIVFLIGSFCKNQHLQFLFIRMAKFALLIEHCCNIQLDSIDLWHFNDYIFRRCKWTK